MTHHGDLESHLRDDINSEAPDIEVSETGDAPAGGAMSAPVEDETLIASHDDEPRPPVEDEAQRGE